MTLVKWNNGNNFNTSLATIFDDFFDRNFNRFDGGRTMGGEIPAVNISEEENSFEVEVAAPGLKKTDFKINLDNNTLTISSESSHVHKEDNN